MSITGKEGNKRQWSTCIVEDFIEMLNKNPKCLKEIDPKNPPSEIADQALSSNECDMSKIQSNMNGYHDWNMNGTLHLWLIICVFSLLNQLFSN